MHNKTLIRLSVHILLKRYLEDGALWFTKVIEYNNIGFDCKIFEDENSKKDSKKAVTNLEEEASKKME